MARETMTAVISQLRSMTATSAGETVIDGVSYWDDDQLEEILDENSSYVFDLRLMHQPHLESNVQLTKRYYIPVNVLPLEDEWVLVDTTGTVVSNLLYTVSPKGMLITFAADTNGVDYLLRGTTFNVYAAAASVWEKKASHRFQLVDFKAGANSISDDQEYQHCLDMYNHYTKKSGGGFKSVRLDRVDYV